jgi:hypothetical protein
MGHDTDPTSPRLPYPLDEMGQGSISPDGWWSPSSGAASQHRPSAHPAGPTPSVPAAGWYEWVRSLPLDRLLGSLAGAVVLFVAVWALLTLGLGNRQPPAVPPRARPAAVSPSIRPTSTPTPAQTELDGVVTIQNLDTQVPFQGTIQLISDDGKYACRNSPQPNSTWTIQLDAGATIAIPCIILASRPSSLPPHTFRRAVSGAGGQGLALMDNLEPFVGSAILPAATSTP